MDFVEDEETQLLSKSWSIRDEDRQRGANFYKDLARTMLVMSRVHMPRIGSVRVDEESALTLPNQPLTFRLHQLKNRGILTGISKDKTHSLSQAYYSDLLSCHDSRLRNQANAIRDRSDGETQLAALSTMHALLLQVVDRGLLNGPFVFHLTDVHPNNVYVDSDWHIRYFIDLEWACTRPKESILPPVWLTSRKVDELPPGPYLEAYRNALEEFFEAFSE